MLSYIPSMTYTESALRLQIVQIGRLMHGKEWIAANDGNITAKLDRNRYLVTPSGVSKGLMRVKDLIVVDASGKVVDGDGKPTSELGMHFAVYESRPEITAVVHAHPPVATGFAVARRALDLAILPEMVVTLGSVPLSEYSLPGTSELVRTLEPFICNFDAILMANHGVVTYGRDLMGAFFRMETVEHTARISLVSEILGGARLLSRSNVDDLIDSRARYGFAPRPDCTRPRSCDDDEKSREESVSHFI